jgi:hypothetical protein
VSSGGQKANATRNQYSVFNENAKILVIEEIFGILSALLPKRMQWKVNSVLPPQKGSADME